MQDLRIQDDLYHYVNQEWLDKAVIPSDRPTTGGFANLDEEVKKILINDIKKMIKDDKYPNANIKKACILYKAASNIKKRNKAGIKPALDYIKPILDLNSIDDLNNNMKEFILKGLALPFVFDIDTDMKDTNHSLIYLSGPSTILPDTTYYKDEMKDQAKALLDVYSNMAKDILKESELSEEEINEYIDDTLKFDAIIATLVKSSQELSEYTKLYNIYSVKKAAKYLYPLDLNSLLKSLYKVDIEKLSIADPRFYKGFNTLFNEDNFKLYKHWAYVKTLLSLTSYLSEDLREKGSIYHRTLMGIASISNIDKYAYNIANQFYSEPIGIYYGKKYFGAKAKKDIEDIVYEVIDTYKKRIKKNDILSKETKNKAIKKLDTMVVKMAYPDKADAFYNKLTFDEKDSYFDIVCELSKKIKTHQLEKLLKETNRNEWAMPGNMVNACYNPFSNDITFPAAILQAPFYSIKQSRSQNLGGIGAVIGHEISHAFDNNGAKFDEFGNLHDWWTKEDFKNFKKKTNAMIKQFSGITLPWGEVNAKLIVSENIADNGGMAVSLNILNNMKDANYEEYFINWAKVWCMKAKQEYLAVLLKVDVHGPHILRTNMPVRNFDEWYKTFNVTKNDKMYIAPNKRVVIW